MHRAETQTWYLERIIRLMAGLFVFGGSLLALFVDVNWVLFTGLVGLMLTIYALTGFCPMSIMLSAFGARERCKC